MRFATVSLAVLLSAFLGTAAAQPAEKGGACRPDVEKFCKGVKPGAGRIVQCLEQHESELSGGCRASIEQGKQKHPCAADAERLCQGVQRGEGRIAECMKKNESQLSPACKARIEQERGRRGGNRQRD